LSVAIGRTPGALRSAPARRPGLILALSFPTCTALACADAPVGTAAVPPIDLGPPVTAVVAGTENSCFLDSSGEVTCWGRWGADPAWGPQQTTPTRTRADDSARFVRITASSHTCALSREGRAYCWGAYNGHGELGDGSTSPRTKPTPVATAHRFIAISAAGRTTCAITGDGALYCWGRNDFGLLATGTRAAGAFETRPVRSLSLARFRALDGGSHFCALSTSDRALCWGNSPGSLDVNRWVAPGDCATRFYMVFSGRDCLVPTVVRARRRWIASSLGDPLGGC
jgi:hypothetical protein